MMSTDIQFASVAHVVYEERARVRFHLISECINQSLQCTFQELLADIGGVLGLFLGLNIFDLVITSAKLTRSMKRSASMPGRTARLRKWLSSAYNGDPSDKSNSTCDETLTDNDEPDNFVPTNQPEDTTTASIPATTPKKGVVFEMTL